MGATHKVAWAVNSTSRVISAAVGGHSLETQTLHEDIRRSLGGSGELTHDGAIAFGGVTDGATNYLNANAAGVNIGDTDTRFIWVRHTGFEYSSATVLGDVTTELIQINADLEHIASLNPGEAWIIPLPATSSNVTNFKAHDASDDGIAIEAIGFD